MQFFLLIIGTLGLYVQLVESYMSYERSDIAKDALAHTCFDTEMQQSYYNRDVWRRDTECSKSTCRIVAAEAEHLLDESIIQTEYCSNELVLPENCYLTGETTNKDKLFPECCMKVECYDKSLAESKQLER